jgi:hypothetical protein
LVRSLCGAVARVAMSNRANARMTNLRMKISRPFGNSHGIVNGSREIE